MASPFFYTATDWYWVVAKSTTIAYWSKEASYVSVSDPAYVAFLTAGGKPTQIDSEADLEAVLAAQYPAGWTSNSSASAATASAAPASS